MNKKTNNMKYILSVLLLLSSISLFSQQNKKLSFFTVENDTIIFYLNEVGDITTKKKANYYRKTKIDINIFNYSKFISDYYMNGQLAFNTTIFDGFLSGKVNAFYKNGKNKFNGFYSNSLKDSLWNFYYPNGNLEKVVIYNLDTPYVKEFYKRNGKLVFNNANGKYVGKIISGFKQTTEYTISGKIKNGMFDGKWSWTGNNTNAVEYFENGIFIKGSSYGLEYTTDPKISLTGFNLHENADIFKFIAIPNTTENNYLFKQMLKYKKSNNLNTTLRIELNNYLRELNEENNLLNYWCFIQFVISKSNELENILVYSNNDIISKKMQEFIENLTGFESPKPNDNSVDCSIYISLVSDNGIITIPEYNFNFGMNIMNLIPND